MGRRTGIGWTDHTFSPIFGCVKIGPGCQFCFAERFTRRLGMDVWGPAAVYREMGDKYWHEPVKWNRTAEQRQVRRRVFCASMSDVFDNAWPDHTRPRLWKLIKATPWIDWQIVTKRAGNIEGMLPEDWGDGYPNVWLIATIVNQEEADRDLPKLLRVPAAIRGVSYEPALGPVDWSPYLGPDKAIWVIGGGESNQGGCRECRIEWLQSAADQCREHGVAFFAKQLGAMPTLNDKPYPMPRQSKGDDPAEWPEALRIRQFPKSAMVPA